MIKIAYMHNYWNLRPFGAYLATILTPDDISWQQIFTSLCDEGLVLCAQWVAFFPLDVFLPHFHLLSFLRGVLWRYRGCIPVQTLHHSLILLNYTNHTTICISLQPGFCYILKRIQNRSEHICHTLFNVSPLPLSWHSCSPYFDPQSSFWPSVHWFPGHEIDKSVFKQLKLYICKHM